MANGALRVWVVSNRGKRHITVNTPEDGAKEINKVATLQLRDPKITWNAFGMEVYEDGEWTEWYSENGVSANELADELWASAD